MRVDGATRDQVVVADLEDLDPARLAAGGQRVDEHQHVELVEQVVGEVHAADAVVDDADAGGQRLGRQPGHDRRTEAVVGQEDVAEAGNQHARGHRVTCS